MERSVRDRGIILLLLLVALFGLLVVGGIDRPPEPALGDYPDTEEFITKPGVYENQHVVTGGQVVETDPVVFRAEYDTASGIETADIEVTGVDKPVKKGDYIQVFGVLTGPQTVDADNVVVVEQTGRWYAWGVSFLAGLWVLGRIVRHWCVDFEAWALRARPEEERLRWGALFRRGDG